MKERKLINLEIGRRIREKREEIGLSRERLAECAGISARFEADIERGIVGPSLATLKSLCEALHISSDSILWGNRTSTRVSQSASYVPPKYDAVFANIIQNMIELTHIAEETPEK